MKKIFISVLLLLSLHGFSQPVKKVVYVIADGLPADVMEKLNLPNFKRIIEEGTYVRMHVGGDKGSYNETPTISAVGYNSLLTGTWVNKHNVPDNDIKAPNYNYQNIFRLFKAQYPKKKTGIYSSWTDNRTKLMGHNLPAAGNLQIDYIADGYELDTVNFKHDNQKDFMHRIDEKVIGQAALSILKEAPDLSWIYLEYTDDMGHMYGDSPQYYTAIQMLDVQMGKIYDAINERKKNHNEDWLLVITTDHGRSEKDGKGHGGQSDRQRSTWMVTNHKELNAYAHTYDPAIVDIMPTIARFSGVKIPKEVLREVDGTPLIGPVSVADVKTNYIQNHIDLSWKVLENTGNVKIWLSTTNNFKTGGKDNYQLLAEVPVKDGHALLNLKDYPSEFYKIVLEAPGNTINRWVMKKEGL